MDQFHREPKQYLVMEFVGHTTLGHQEGLDIFDIDPVFLQIFDAVAYIHGKEVAHRDLKPENILVKGLNPMHIQLGDFGLATAEPMQTFLGTLLYVPPEMGPSKEKYTVACDVWSLGVMLLRYSSSGGLPEEPTESLATPVGVRTWRDQWLRSISDTRDSARARLGCTNLVRLAATMLSVEPASRPDIAHCAATLKTSCTLTERLRTWTSRESGHRSLIRFINVLKLLGLEDATSYFTDTYSTPSLIKIRDNRQWTTTRHLADFIDEHIWLISESTLSKRYRVSRVREVLSQLQ